MSDASNEAAGLYAEHDPNTCISCGDRLSRQDKRIGMGDECWDCILERND